MPKSAPYQPSLLRLLHGIAGILLFGAWLSGFWVYDVYDQRWGHLGLPTSSDVQDIHGTLAVAFLIIFPLFALYSLRLGDRRLLQPQTLDDLKKWGKPIWWLTIHRLVNTLTLFAATFAILTGRMMEESWLPKTELNHAWYIAHLIAWISVFLGVAAHLLMNAKIGGLPFLLSIIKINIREGDRPKTWLKKFPKWPISKLTTVLECLIFGGIALGLLLSSVD